MTWLNPSRYRIALRHLWRSAPADQATTCHACALRWYPSARHQSCPGCEAKRGRELREVIEAALMRLRTDRSNRT